MAKVLLVEDEPDIRDLVRMALEMDAHEVSVAGTADEGLMRARDFAPDLILMDIALGGPVDGLEVTRLLRADASFDRTPIVALTAHAMSGDRERALAAGCDEHWTKPITDLTGFQQMVTRVAHEGRHPA
ncbi:MAG TPA: response regulator [Pyrinomonadaceae bacterium]|nr:response regulator [Pyrinomonadaceae bacterium]